MKPLTCCKLPESQLLYRWHKFANNTEHISCHCPKCGKHLGHIPQTEPYISWVKGNYIPEKPAKQIPTQSRDAINVLAAIIAIPGIEKQIGSLLYNQAKNIVKSDELAEIAKDVLFMKGKK